jgi:hypothetical protein
VAVGVFALLLHLPTVAGLRLFPRTTTG